MDYGTNIAAGVTPGKGGQKFENSVPIYNTCLFIDKAQSADNRVSEDIVKKLTFKSYLARCIYRYNQSID